jgi:hypothetical protein
MFERSKRDCKDGVAWGSMKVKRYLSAKEGRHRVRLSTKECQLIFAFVLKKLVYFNQLIEKYEELKEKAERNLPYVRNNAKREWGSNPIHQQYEATVEAMKKIEPADLRIYVRLYDKMYRIVGEPQLKPEYSMVRDDVVEWIRHPFFFKPS